KAELTMPAYLKTPATSTFMNGIEMGTPFDSIVDAPNIGAGSAIASGFGLTEVLGQIQASATIRRIETTEDLYSALEITASLDVQGKSWGVSASTTYARERRLKAESLYILVEARATGRTQKVTNAQLAPEAKNLSPDEFYKRYGDRYANAVVMGQQIFGLIEIHTSSIEEKESIAATLGVSYGPVTFSTSIKSTLDTVRTSFDETVTGDALGTTPPALTSVS